MSFTGITGVSRNKVILLTGFCDNSFKTLGTFSKVMDKTIISTQRKSKKSKSVTVLNRNDRPGIVIILDERDAIPIIVYFLSSDVKAGSSVLFTRLPDPMMSTLFCFMPCRRDSL